MGRGNRSCRNITNKHKTAKKYKQTENNSQPPKSTINSLPNPQAPGTRRQRCLPVRRHCSASPSVCLCEDMPESGRVSGGLQRCHAGSLDMHVHGDTRVQKRGCIKPLCPGVKCSYTLAQWLFAAMASALSEETLAASSARSNQLPCSLRTTHRAGLAPNWSVLACTQKMPATDVAGAPRAGKPATLHLHCPGDLPARGMVLHSSTGGLASSARPRHLQLCT